MWIPLIYILNIPDLICKMMLLKFAYNTRSFVPYGVRSLAPGMKVLAMIYLPVKLQTGLSAMVERAEVVLVAVVGRGLVRLLCKNRRGTPLTPWITCRCQLE